MLGLVFIQVVGQFVMVFNMFIFQFLVKQVFVSGYLVLVVGFLEFVILVLVGVLLQGVGLVIQKNFLVVVVIMFNGNFVFGGVGVVLVFSGVFLGQLLVVVLGFGLLLLVLVFNVILYCMFMFIQFKFVGVLFFKFYQLIFKLFVFVGVMFIIQGELGVFLQQFKVLQNLMFMVVGKVGQNVVLLGFFVFVLQVNVFKQLLVIIIGVVLLQFFGVLSKFMSVYFLN